MKLKVLFIVLTGLILTAQLSAQVTTVQSGSWQSGATWSGGVVPNASTNVLISTGTIVSIDAGTAVCNSITFADTSSHLVMASATSILDVYGDFTLFSMAHKAFSSWATGAKIVFTGSAIKQTLSGWNNATGTSTVFMEMIVDKDTGVVATARNNMRFAFGNSLEVKKGTFLLDSLDDMESKSIGGTGLIGTITVQSAGTFTMGGGGSYIRRGTFLLSSDSIPPRIGKMTVYGKVLLTSTSSSGMNFGGIEIMDGGLVTLATGGSAGYFNPANILVHSGGVLQSNTTTVVYHASASVTLEAGGEFNSTSSTTPLPPNGLDYSHGTLRFSRSNIQTIPALFTTCNNMYLSGSGIKTVSADLTINGTLSFRGSASLDLAGHILTYGNDAILQYGAPGQSTPQTTTDVEFPDVNGPRNLSIYNTGGVTLHANRTIPGILTLSSGQFDNNGAADDKALSLGSGASIRRASGTLSSAPVFGSPVNVSYISTVSAVTTGFELPTDPALLKDLTITSTKGVDLGADVTVNGNLLFSTGAAELTTNTHTLTLGPAATLSGEMGTSYIKGIVKAERAVGAGASDFGGLGFSLSAGSDNLGNVAVTRTSAAVSVNSKQGIARNWNVVAGAQPAAGRTVTLSWAAGDDNAIPFSSTYKAGVAELNNGTWKLIGSSQDVSVSDPRSISAPATSLGTFTVIDTTGPNAVQEAPALSPKDYVLHQNYPNPFNPSTVIRFDIGTSQFVHIDVVNVLGHHVATLVNQNLQSGSHSVSFNGAGLSSGVYFAVMHTNNRTQLIKMLLMK